MLKVESKQDKPPAGCYDYKWLTNPKRNTYHASPSVHKCDKSGQQEYTISPDWQGTYWYRINPSIGTKIPVSATKENHCGTYATGWIQGSSTTSLGQTIESKVCFSYSGKSCRWEAIVKIRNCGHYNLYYLPDTPVCYLGYCVE